MKIIVGLGNPGLRYKKTRHNAGFLALGQLAKKYRIAVKKKGFQGVYGIGRIKGEEVLLFEPLTYMNLSGEAIEAVCANKLESKEDLLIISDDIDLPLGSIRVRKTGSSGGHNGLKSIMSKMGSEFTRLRIGVSSGEPFEVDAATYVLARFSRNEMRSLEGIFPDIVSCVETWLSDGAQVAMNKFN